MNQRGRKSAAALMVVKNGEIDAIQRPQPPEYLTEEAAQVWISVVNTMPAEWFTEETHIHLSDYCCRAVQLRRIAKAIEDLMRNGGDDWIDDYDKLLKMQDRESRGVHALARGMRLTHQAQYHPEKRRNGGAGVKKPF